jgi:LysM repeat protein
MTRRPAQIVLLAVLLAVVLGAAIGGVSQLTAVDSVDPRSGNVPVLTPTPIPSPAATPEFSATPSAAATPTPTPETGGEVWVYTIASGDSVSGLAIRFGTTTSELLSLNPEYADNQDLVEVGATMIMPCTPIAAAEDRC